jgi:hypothetical protein
MTTRDSLDRSSEELAPGELPVHSFNGEKRDLIGEGPNPHEQHDGQSGQQVPDESSIAYDNVLKSDVC